MLRKRVCHMLHLFIYCTKCMYRIFSLHSCLSGKQACARDAQLSPYLDMLMRSFSWPIKSDFVCTWRWKTAWEAGSSAELRLKPVAKTQRIQCREKQGLTVRGTLLLWNLGIFAKYCKNYQNPSWINNLPLGFKVYSLVCPERASTLTILTLFWKNVWDRQLAS